MTTIAFREEIDTSGAENAAGIAGLALRDGIINEEVNQELRSYQRRFEFFKEMTNDAAIATLLDCIKLPLLASEFTVVAASEAPNDLFLRDLIQANMHGMYRQTWASHVRDMLESLEFGFALSEIVMEKRSDGYLYLRNLDPRGQETLSRWTHDPQEGFTEFVQRDAASGQTYTIPLDKTVHVTLRGRKNNPEGISFLRPLYRTYKLKKEFEVFEAIATERDMGGMPIAELPEHSVIPQETLNALDSALGNMRRNTQAFLRLPPGVRVNAYRGERGIDIGKIIMSLKMDIFFRGFAQFLTLGTTGTGTQALVQGDLDFFHLGLIAIQQELMDSWNQQLVPYILLANGIELSNVTPPKIQWTDPGHTSIRDTMEAYKIGVETGLYEANDADEDYFRAVQDLPPRTAATAETTTTGRNRTIKPFVAAAYAAQGVVPSPEPESEPEPSPSMPTGPAGGSESGNDG